MKIFVSSAYEDLKDHRNAVDVIINRICHQYKGMEYFGSRAEEPKEVCFAEIKKCKIFIGIYAHRYGWIPENDDKSITEQEFDYAKKNGLKCLCYLVNENHPWPPNYIESDKSHLMKPFLHKVNKLVRSTFKSPDNLASQIAADLVRISQEKITNNDTLSIKKQVYLYCEQEIKSSIGSKYIKGLYVQRKLEKNLKKDILEIKNIHMDFYILSNKLLEIKDIYDSIEIDKLKVTDAKLKEKEKKKEKEKANNKLKNEYRRLYNRLNRSITFVQSFQNVKIIDIRICYPSNELLDTLNNIKEDLARFKLKFSYKFLDYTLSKMIDQKSDEINDLITSILNKFLPVTLIIDRAGGGKTNLLCHLSEILGKQKHCFFFAAKSIIEPNSESIFNYINSVYPISDDPISLAIDEAKKENDVVLIIIDGINENLHPLLFNSAFKIFIRRFYNLPVRFFISCRDIYWKYFNDEWWHSHSNKIFNDELYSFSKSEFKKAIPLYLDTFKIQANLSGNASIQLHHPLLLRFFCEAYHGTDDQLNAIGDVDSISLLSLFDLYCDRKFNLISERLKILSSDDIYLFVEMIAKLMLHNKIRLLPIELLSEKSKTDFNESNIRTLASRYVQVLDENILIEEKPFGPNMNIKVGFVYDEFLEYILAKAYWRENFPNRTQFSLKKSYQIIDTLLELEKDFISIIGIISYIGEIIVSHSNSKGLKLIDYLITRGQINIALKILSRWPDKYRDDRVFDKLEFLYETSQTARFKSDVWREMVTVSNKHWDSFLNFIKSIDLKGYQKPLNVFTALKQINGGHSFDRQIETAVFIYNIFKEQKYMPLHKDSLEYRGGVSTVKYLYKINSAQWSKIKQRKYTKIIEKFKSL